MDVEPQSTANRTTAVVTSRRRRMTRGELLSRHTHQAESGQAVHIWERGGKYLARGRIDGWPFGKTLGRTEKDAESALRRLLVELEDGVFVRPSEVDKRQLKTGRPPRLGVRELCNRFLVEKRSLLGESTMSDYRGRLVPLIEFAETEKARRRWPLAADVDREFAIEFSASLRTRITARNGRPAAVHRTISKRQIWNTLDVARSLFHWARKPEVNLLPSIFPNPFTVDIVGQKARKDPARPHPLPLDARVQLVRSMDLWQLTHLAVPMLLGPRPDEYTRILISDVSLSERRIQFGERFGGKDFNKGKQAFTVPFPAAIEPLILVCMGGRQDGPLLRRRAVFAGRKPEIQVETLNEIEEVLDLAVAEADPAQLQTAQDVKKLVARVFLDMGAISPDSIGTEFKAVLCRSGLTIAPRLYDLRGAFSTDLKAAGVDYLVQRYVTGHATNDVMNAYSAIDVTRDMERYFNHIRPLLDAMSSRAADLGIK